MIQYFNNEKVVLKYIQLWYEYSHLKVFKYIMQKVFSICLYNLNYFYSLEEITEIFKNFNDKKVQKVSKDLCNITDNKDLCNIIEEEIF